MTRKIISKKDTSKYLKNIFKMFPPEYKGKYLFRYTKRGREKEGEAKDEEYKQTLRNVVNLHFL